MKRRIIFILLIFPFLYGKVLIPQENVNHETLSIHGKVREYYILKKNTYIVSGPSIVSVYARLAVPKNEKGKYSFSLISFLSDAPESIHNFSKKVDSSVTSSLHPMHRYTKFGKAEIKIPEGKFILSIENPSQIGTPILTRLIQKRDKR